jgi:hypothetical protein
MIAFLISIFVLWLVWQWLCRSTYVEIAPRPPSMHGGPDAADRDLRAPCCAPPRLFGGRDYGLREQMFGAE